MFLKSIFVGILGLSFGLLTAAGVFTVLIAVGLIPRFAGKTHTSKKVLLYEEMVVLGTLVGGILSIFKPFVLLGTKVVENGGLAASIWTVMGNVVISAYGLFGGMFVGCLALAIAEMLDSIPIFTRRIQFRHGIGTVVLCMALGKLFGSFFYFIMQIH